MKALWEHDGPTWTLRLGLHPEDPVTGRGQGTSSVGLLVREATVELPVSVPDPHPDLEAFAALVIARPWIKRRLVVRRGVSRGFATVVERMMRIELSPVDDGLSERSPGDVPLLAYSAGYDSTAVSVLLPDIPHIHHRRVPHPRVVDRAINWRADALERLALRAGSRGRDLHIVRANFEYLVHGWPTLPHWYAFAVGPLLMADSMHGGSLVFGGTLETYYMDNGKIWKGAGKGDPLPASLGLPVMRPLAGITEIGAMKLVLDSDLADAARSCTLGTLTKPCHACAKCIRKDMLIAAIRQKRAKLPPEAPGWTSVQGDLPYYMQAQLEYATSRLQVADGPVARLRERLGNPKPQETEWMNRAYRPAVDVAVPVPWRARVHTAIEEKLGWMDDEDMAMAHSWDRTQDVS